MARRATAKSGNGAAAAEASAPASGYNGPSASVVAQALADLTQLETEQQRIGARKANIIKGFEKAGGDGDDLKYTLKLWKLDAGEARARIQRRYRYCAFVGIVVPETQRALDEVLDETKPVSGDAERQLVGARAYNDGFNSARNGGAIGDCPHTSRPGSIQYVQWRDGWQDGHEEWLRADPSRRERENQSAAAGAAEAPEADEAQGVAPPA